MATTAITDIELNKCRTARLQAGHRVRHSHANHRMECVRMQRRSTTPTVSSLLQRVVRTFLSSLRIEGYREPLALLEKMRRKNAALLRRSPALRQALAVVLSETTHGVQAKAGAQKHRSSSDPRSSKATKATRKLSSGTSADSKGTLLAKTKQPKAKRDHLGH